MDTKEAIDVLIFSDNGIGHWRQNYRKIIKLLEEGEAYRQMWEELDHWYSDESCTDYDWAVCNIMYKLEQKYFPKEK